MSAGFYLYVWGDGTGLPNLDRSVCVGGVPSKTFKSIRLNCDISTTCL